MTEYTQTHDEYFHTLLDRRRLDKIFGEIGVDVYGLQSKTQLAPSFDSGLDAPPLPPSLKSVARLLVKAASR
jgi:hypothetical protein